jgi:hypothetical protein
MSGDCSGCGAFGPFGEVEGSRPARIQDANRRTRSGPLYLLRRLSLAIAAGLPIVTALGAPSAAMVDWLVLLVDASESIDPHDYRLQREAYVDVLQDPAIDSLLEGARIAIVEFATTPQVVVAWTDDSRRAARAYAAHTRDIRGPGPHSLTGIARALEVALDMLEDKAGRRVIDIRATAPTTSTGSLASGRSASGRASCGSRSMAWRSRRRKNRRSIPTTHRMSSRASSRSRASTSTSSARC